MGFRHASKEFAKAVPAPAWCMWITIIVLGVLGTTVAIAEAAVTYEPAPAHKCYAVLHALGSKPVEVPCSTPTPTPTATQAEATTPTATPQTSTPTVQAPTPSRILPTPHPTDHRCFPASDWGPVSDAVRPCVRIVGNSPELGALHFAVRDASGVVRYSGYINTPFRKIIHVHVIRVEEDGSFTWKARSQDGRTVTAGVGNLED